MAEDLPEPTAEDVIWLKSNLRFESDILMVNTRFLARLLASWERRGEAIRYALKRPEFVSIENRLTTQTVRQLCEAVGYPPPDPKTGRRALGEDDG